MYEKKTLISIEDEIISSSEGAFSIAVTDDYEALSSIEQSEVDDIVGEQIQPCGSCGWNWHVDSLETSLEWDEDVCYSCADTERRDAEEEENEAECGRCGETNDFGQMNIIEGEYVCVNCENCEDDE